MKEIYNGETVALGGHNLVTKQVVVDDTTGEKAKFTYDKTTGAVTVLDEVDPDSVNPVTARAVATAVAGASGEVPIIGDDDNGKVLKAVVSGGEKSVEWGEAAPAITVDQSYNASSTNPQSGTAVAQAIAAIPSDVSTASGHFDLEGSVPVTVNYTGTPHVVPGTATYTNPTITELGDTGLAIVFTLDPAHALTATESGALHIPTDSPGTITVNVCYTNSTTGVGGPAIDTSPILPKQVMGSVESGDYTLTSQFIVPGYDNYVELIIAVPQGTDRSSVKTWAESLSLDWPSSVVDGYETTIPAVDQNYSASSTNPQSGTAVAQAIAAIPSASYSAGDGIDITSGTISVGHDDTLSSTYRYETQSEDEVSETYKAGIAIMSGSPLDFVINDSEDADATLKIHIPGNTFFSDLNNLVAAKVIIADTVEFDHNAYAPDATLSVTYDSQNYRYVIDEQDVEIKAFYQEWEPIGNGLLDRATYLGFGFYTDGGPQTITPSHAAQVSSTTLTDPVVIDVPTPMANKLLSVANPVPASVAGDAGKVLTVDAEGAPAWGMLGSVKSIQQVNELPASPDANTLYLIPEA